MDETGFTTSYFDTQRRDAMRSQQLDLAETAAQAAKRAKAELQRITQEVEPVARRLEELRVFQ